MFYLLRPEVKEEKEAREASLEAEARRTLSRDLLAPDSR
jgi:hypothetical protein